MDRFVNTIVAEHHTEMWQNYRIYDHEFPDIRLNDAFLLQSGFQTRFIASENMYRM